MKITSDQAETILFALALRSKQKGLSPELQNDAYAIGQRLEKEFITQFGWNDKTGRMDLYRYPIKTVSIKCYDLPPATDRPDHTAPR